MLGIFCGRAIATTRVRQLLKNILLGFGGCAESEEKLLAAIDIFDKSQQKDIYLEFFVGRELYLKTILRCETNWVQGRLSFDNLEPEELERHKEIRELIQKTRQEIRDLERSLEERTGMSFSVPHLEDPQKIATRIKLAKEVLESYKNKYRFLRDTIEEIQKRDTIEEIQKNN
jgi:hypothetical protein